jgi:hypothetical protein
MAITMERVHEIGYELFMDIKIRDLSFREGKVRKDDLKTEIGRLSKQTGIPKDELVEFMKVAAKDLRDRVSGKIQKIIDTFDQITFEK